MKIALIGPGIMPIPSNKWGAVESIIWQYKLSLEKLGCQVDIYNEKNLESILDPIHNGKYDIVHSHYDEHIPWLNQNLKVPYISTTHFGYIHQPNMWGGYYEHIFNASLNSPAILALSPEIQSLYLNRGYKGKIKYLRNGAEVEKFKFEPNQGNGKAICVGKIETRKCQGLLSQLLANKVNIDFVGPLGNDRIKESDTIRYLGEWSKDTLYNELYKYNALILISEGEAAPLVVPEGLAAGLSIVVNQRAAANLDDNLPYISVLPEFFELESLINSIQFAIERNPVYKESIRQYAENYFSWDLISKEYLGILNEWKNE